MSGKNIVLCVKPYSLPDLAPKLTGEADAVYSVLAGTSIESLKAQIKAKKYIITMPNLGASHLKSMTSITGDETLKENGLSIFNKIGISLWLSSENALDIATGVAVVPGLVDFVSSMVNPQTYAACFLFNSQNSLDLYQQAVYVGTACSACYACCACLLCLLIVLARRYGLL